MRPLKYKSVMSEPTLTSGSDPTHRSAQRLWFSDDDFQSEMLKGVSRTFALTIPQLPAGLCRVVANAYLLCRIVDTIEDEPSMSGARKIDFCQQFLRSLEGDGNAEALSRRLCASLSSRTPPAEHELIRNLSRVLRITQSFTGPQREALHSCVRTMAEGMGQFQLRADKLGLQSLEELDQYCYYVAGVVGQMLTQLFCLYSSDIAKNLDALMALAVSFGQGLQMTNVLKDVWEDNQQGACWLPREIFAEEGFDLSNLSIGRNPEAFEHGIRRLIGISHGHLRNALTYSLLIPKYEIGIRNFCLWAIGLAVLTLRKINRFPQYTNGNQVKISRLSVKGAMWFTGSSVKHDALLKLLFYIAAWRLPLWPQKRLVPGAKGSKASRPV